MLNLMLCHAPALRVSAAEAVRAIGIVTQWAQQQAFTSDEEGARHVRTLELLLLHAQAAAAQRAQQQRISAFFAPRAVHGASAGAVSSGAALPAPNANPRETKVPARRRVIRLHDDDDDTPLYSRPNCIAKVRL